MTLPGNWKTTLFGFMAALFGFVAFSPDLFARWPFIIALSKYFMIGGLAGLGAVGRDANGPPSVKTLQIEEHLNAVDATTQELKKD